MDIENIPMIEDDQLEKFILSLCYRPSFTKRTIPGIQDDMDYDIERMRAEIKAGCDSKQRKVLLYARIDGRERMKADMQTIFNNKINEVCTLQNND